MSKLNLFTLFAAISLAAVLAATAQASSGAKVYKNCPIVSWSSIASVTGGSQGKFALGDPSTTSTAGRPWAVWLCSAHSLHKQVQVDASCRVPSGYGTKRVAGVGGVFGYQKLKVGGKPADYYVTGAPDHFVGVLAVWASRTTLIDVSGQVSNENVAALTHTSQAMPAGTLAKLAGAAMHFNCKA